MQTKWETLQRLAQQLLRKQLGLTTGTVAG